MTVTERKYALTKIAPGDYVFPSNDGQIIWRVSRYPEGPSSGIMDWPRDQNFWGIWRWEGRVSPDAHVTTDDWNDWEMCEGGHDSRADAIQAAINAS